MNSAEESIQPVESSSSSKQASNSVLLDLIARKLSRIEVRPDLRSITLVITLDRRGRPRTVIFRTESKSELSA